MAIAAVKVMAAGKSGLDALPYFVKEFKRQEYRLLEPLGLDHDPDTIDKTNERFKEIDEGSYGNGVCRQIRPEDSGRASYLLGKINPIVAATSGTALADSPARIGAWCRVQLQSYCDETLREWTRWSNENRTVLHSDSDPLLVVIPYCPEGPTSGTIGMYLGAMLRKTFADVGRDPQLLVCGVELCPPTDKKPGDAELSDTAAKNVFRGYVARQEMMRGCPLTDDPDDTELHKCFDVNLVFDAGAEMEDGNREVEEVWPAMDWASAQTTALLFRGAANNGDVMEAVNMLKLGRWEVNLTHVVSEREYSPVILCQRYRSRLPWHALSEKWPTGGLEDKRDTFVTAFDRMSPGVDTRMEGVKGWFEDIKHYADLLRDLKIEEDTWLDKVTPKGRKESKKRKDRKDQVKRYLSRVEEIDGSNYAEIRSKYGAEAQVKFPKEAYCVNIKFTEDIRNKVIKEEVPTDIADLVGRSAQGGVRDTIKGLVNDYLERRHDCVQATENSKAFFERIMTVSAMKKERSAIGVSLNRAFCPGNEDIKFYLSREVRGEAGSFGAMNYPVDVRLYWQPLNLTYEIPVEYTLLVAARVRESDGFKDVWNYKEMKDLYDKTVRDSEKLKTRLQYYGVRPPKDSEDLWEQPSAPETKQSSDDGAMPKEPVTESSPPAAQTTPEAATAATSPSADQTTPSSDTVTSAAPSSAGKGYREVLRDRNGTDVAGSQAADGASV